MVAFLLALASGVYLGTLGVMPDPVPFIDEGIAVIVLLNSLAWLGLDLRRFFGVKTSKSGPKATTIDID